MLQGMESPDVDDRRRTDQTPFALNGFIVELQRCNN
jgi:hypothetical protein